MQTQFNPNMPPQMQAQSGVKPPIMQPQASPEAPAPAAEAAAPEYDPAIIEGLEEHLSQIPEQQKQFLVDAIKNIPQVVIPVLGMSKDQHRLLDQDTAYQSCLMLE